MVTATEFLAVDGEDCAKQTAEGEIEHTGVLTIGLRFKAGGEDSYGGEGVVNVPLGESSRLTGKRLEDYFDNMRVCRLTCSCSSKYMHCIVNMWVRNSVRCDTSMQRAL